MSYLDPDGFHGFIFKAAAAGRVKCITSFSGLFYLGFYNDGGGGGRGLFSVYHTPEDLDKTLKRLLKD